MTEEIWGFLEYNEKDDFQSTIVQLAFNLGQHFIDSKRLEKERKLGILKEQSLLIDLLHTDDETSKKTIEKLLKENLKNVPNSWKILKAMSNLTRETIQEFWTKLEIEIDFREFFGEYRLGIMNKWWFKKTKKI